MLTVPLLPNYLSSALLYLDQCQDIIHPPKSCYWSLNLHKKQPHFRSTVTILSPFSNGCSSGCSSCVRLGLKAQSFEAPTLRSIVCREVLNTRPFSVQEHELVWGTLILPQLSKEWSNVEAATGMDLAAGVPLVSCRTDQKWALAVSTRLSWQQGTADRASSAWHCCRGNSWRCTHTHCAFNLCHRECQSCRDCSAGWSQTHPSGVWFKQ